MNNVWSLMMLLLVFVACSDHTKVKVAEAPIQKDDFIDLLAEIHLIDAASKQKQIPDNRLITNRYAQFKGVIQNHGFTKAEFDSTMSYYAIKPKEFNTVYDSVLVRLSRLELKHIARKDSLKE